MPKDKDITAESKILDAAKNVFQRKGMFGARVQEIADEANINKAMIHYYFRNKQQLFDVVFMREFASMIPHAVKFLNGDSSIENKIREFVFNHISFLQKNPYLASFIFQELNRDPETLKKMRAKMGVSNIEKFKRQVQEEIKNGQLKPIDPEQLFINIVSLNLFPFIGAPMIKVVLNLDDDSFNQLMEERKTEVANFIINSIKA